MPTRRPTKDPERCKCSNEIEKRIDPLVKALNKIGSTRTFGSCQGHFGFQEPKPFNGRAYVEFRMPRDKFRELKRAVYESINDDRCKIEFDDYLPDGAYFYGSLYIIPNKRLKHEEQRDITGKTINELTKIVRRATSGLSKKVSWTS
jgi:hypothetical protein